MNEKEKGRALKLYENGNLQDLYKFIRPHLDKDDPYAHFLYSKFSLSEWNESDEEFERRYIKHLKLASDGKIPDAMYTLGQLHLYGLDGAEKDERKTTQLLKEAAELGHLLSMFCYGQHLIYGTNGIEKDEELGFRYLEEAHSNGVEEAGPLIQEIKRDLQGKA